MQALVATSRSISQDRFLQRQKKRKYQQHVRKIEDITQKKQHPVLSQLKQQEKMVKTLYKSKSCAKKFGTQENTTEIKRQNRLLLEKIWKMSSSIKCENSKEQQQLQHVSGSNWHLKKKQAQIIKEQNKRIASNIISTRMEVKDYKKKMTNEIKEYLELRNQIRKFKVDQKSVKKNSKQPRNRINTQRIRVTLKLNDDEDIEKQQNKTLNVKPQKIIKETNSTNNTNNLNKTSNTKNQQQNSSKIKPDETSKPEDTKKQNK